MCEREASGCLVADRVLEGSGSASDTPCGGGGGPNQSGISGGRTPVPASRGTQEMIRGGDGGLLIWCVDLVNVVSGW